MPPITRHQHAGRTRTPPGAMGQGRYWRIIVRPERDFTLYRTHDVGRRGGVLRLAGLRPTGSWATQAWFINKHAAYIRRGTLVAHGPKTEAILKTLPVPPRHVKGDIFVARPGKSSKRKDKPTPHIPRPRRVKER